MATPSSVHPNLKRIELTVGKYTDQFRVLNKQPILILNILCSFIYIVFSQSFTVNILPSWYSFKIKIGL